VPYCSSCRRLISPDLDTCPHCRVDIRNKRSYYQLKVASDQAIVDKLEVESKSMETWHRKGLLRTSRTLRQILSISRVRLILDRLNLTLKEGVAILILTYLFGFISLVGYVRTAPGKLGSDDIISLFYGLPLECLQVRMWVRPMFVYDIIILWIAFVVDFVLYLGAAFALVYMIARLRR
jgi:RNA polymerase subunit RPABC4/transcription elongation factor Spt4